jgi:hypothetical protein
MAWSVSALWLFLQRGHSAKELGKERVGQLSFSANRLRWRRRGGTIGYGIFEESGLMRTLGGVFVQVEVSSMLATFVMP